MSITNPSFLLDATLAATGGTAKAFTLDSLKVANGIALIESSYSDYRVARRLTLKSKPSVYDRNTGLWSAAKKEAVVTLPVVLANGLTEFQSFTLVHIGSAEVAMSVQDTLRNLTAQTLFDADLTDFWRYGTLA
jgi:hypothetical protein